MKKDKLVSKLRKADGNITKFILLANQVVDLEVDSDPDNKKVISMFTARDMAFGAQVSRNKHIAIGVVVGVVSTAGVYGAFKLREAILKRRKENED